MNREIDEKIMEILMASLMGKKDSLDINSIYGRLEIRRSRVSQSYLRERLKDMVEERRIIRQRNGQGPYHYSLPTQQLLERK